MSIATQIQALQQDKTDIANAITTKGGTVGSGDGFDDFATDIATIPSGIIPTGTKDITENGTHDVTNYANANVQVSPSLQFKFINENGNYYPDEGYDGFSDVEVSVYPALEDVEITENGTYTSSEYDGYGTVTVNVSGGGLYNGASGEDLFPNTTTNHTITFPATTPSAYLYTRMFARYRGGYSDVIFPGTLCSTYSFDYFAQYGHVKSFTADNLTELTAGHEFYYAFQHSTVEKLSFKNLTSISGTYVFYCLAQQSSVDTTLKEIDFSSLTTLTSASNAFCYAFQRCRGLYPNKVAHPFPALTTTTGSNAILFGYCFSYGRATMYVFDKLTGIGTANSGANEFIYAFANNVWDYRSGDTDGRKCGVAFPMVTQVGYTSSATGIYANCKYLLHSGTNNCALYMTSLITIHNPSTTNSNGQFAYCNAKYIYMPKLTTMTTKPEYVFYGSTTTTELHFGIENQATVEALTGYSSKFGATSATMYFDLANHLTINGTVYDRDGSTDDYDNWYFGFTNGSTTYYINNYYGNVGDVAYTKSGDTYTTSGYTVTAVS